MTPLGMGVAFGIFHLKDAHQESIGERVVVRLPVDEKTREHLSSSNCLTHKAKESALFTFPVSEIGQGCIEAMIIIGLVFFVLLFVCNDWPW
jgi:hypothetical protein